MYSAAFARNAYGETDRTQGVPRRTEYQAFAQVTHRIARAAAEGAEGFPRLAEAMHENVRLWNTLAVDLADPRNGLSQELKGGLLSLFAFTHRQTGKVLAGEAAADVLVEINTAVMRGLRGEGVGP